MSNVSMVDGHIDKITNYDRIRSMSIDEMAEFICSIYDDNQEPYTADKNIEGYTIPDYDENNIKEWLEQEVSEWQTRKRQQIINMTEQ